MPLFYATTTDWMFENNQTYAQPSVQPWQPGMTVANTTWYTANPGVPLEYSDGIRPILDECWTVNQTTFPQPSYRPFDSPYQLYGVTPFAPYQLVESTYFTYNSAACINPINALGYVETEEQKVERQRQAHLDDRAALRAKALLLEHLDEQQQTEYEKSGYFHVLSEGGRLYRIRRGIAGNVCRIGSDGAQRDKFCIHFTDTLPPEDHMLGQLLLLKYDEEQFLATANRS